MRTHSIGVGFVLVFFPLLSMAGVWTDPFDGNKLVKEWSFRDRPAKTSTAEVKDGWLRLLEPTGNWGHLEKDKPMLERAVPATAKDMRISGVFSSDPEKPGDAWHGLFLFGDDPLDFACLLFGGESNQAQKFLIGSMVQGGWQDKGHFPLGLDVPFEMMLEKVGNTFKGSVRKTAGDAWTTVGAAWNHDLKVKTAGLGFINSWGGKKVTLLVDSFSLDGEGVLGLAVEPQGKMATAWAALKQ
jgi:hypothetical protein